MENIHKTRINPVGTLEVFGYSKDVWHNGKYYGSIRMDDMDRETVGYHGRRTEITDVDIRFKKKIIKAGSQIMTEIFPLCGKLIKK